VVQYVFKEPEFMGIVQALSVFSGLSLASHLTLSAMTNPMPAAPADRIAAHESPSNRGTSTSKKSQNRAATKKNLADLLDRLRHTDNSDANSYPIVIGAHHKLLGLYWRQLASDRVATLPLVTLMGSGGRFSGCGGSRG